MKRLFQILIALFFALNLSAQNIKIDPKIKVDSTVVQINESDIQYFAYSSHDNKKSDSLIVSISTMGTSTASIIINLTKNPHVSISLFSDYKEYDGQHIKNIDAETYELELNAVQYKLGDRIMGRVKGISKPISSSSGDYRIEFQGEFSVKGRKAQVKLYQPLRR